MRKDIQRVVLTGGPCCGKTTLLNGLAERAYSVVPEAARMIIEENQKREGEYVPWINLYGFQQKTTERVLELEHSFEDSLLFCDRGVVDGHGYSVSGKIPTPELIKKFSVKRYDTVFILDPIPVYQKDEARRENPEEAKKVHAAIWNAYREFGYSPIRVPIIGGKEERTEYFIKLLEQML